jgi:hypothetical protein
MLALFSATVRRAELSTQLSCPTEALMILGDVHTLPTLLLQLLLPDDFSYREGCYY